MAPKNAISKDRYDRERWIVAALNVLTEKGSERITVRQLSQELGVTTGSFYWHFGSREDLVRAIADHWYERFTVGLGKAIEAAAPDPAARLLALMKALATDEYSRFEIPVRAWSAEEPILAKTVNKADRYRTRVVSELFQALGFEEPELGMRVRTFVVFHSTDIAFGKAARTYDARMAEAELRHEFFTRE
ncbi:MAG: TetR/AcrR family transcriptional regulator [Gammaproteobacteria bacterium]